MSASRRATAILALAAPVAALVVTAAALVERPLALLAGVVSLTVAIAAAAYALTRTGARRALAAIVAVLALVAPLVLIVANGDVLWLLVALALLAVAAAATRHALARDITSLKSGTSPGEAVGPAARAVLILNPWSGGGKVEHHDLVAEAGRRGIEAVVLTRGDDLLELARNAVSRGADVIGMAGGDGSQALVAGVAMEHDVGYVCIPAGTRNHLAMDLGLDRDDVVGALDAFGDALERRIDLALVGDRVFVNNTSMGLYAKIVQSPAYRDRKVGTALELLPSMLGPQAEPFDLRFTGPDGTENHSAHLILVSNGRYSWRGGEGFGSRRHITDGALSIVAATFESSAHLARFVQRQAAGLTPRPPGWLEWTATTFELRSGAPVEAGVDGEALLLDAPVRFRIVPGAVRVRVPRHAPGYSPAAVAPTRGWSTVTALLQTAAGRPVAIEG